MGIQCLHHCTTVWPLLWLTSYIFTRRRWRPKVGWIWRTLPGAKTLPTTSPSATRPPTPQPETPESCSTLPHWLQVTSTPSPSFSATSSLFSTTVGEAYDDRLEAGKILEFANILCRRLANWHGRMINLLVLQKHARLLTPLEVKTSPDGHT